MNCTVITVRWVAVRSHLGQYAGGLRLEARSFVGTTAADERGQKPSRERATGGRWAPLTQVALIEHTPPHLNGTILSAWR